MVSKIVSVMDVGFMEDHLIYFGNILYLRESNVNGNFVSTSAIAGWKKKKCAVIEMQLDDVRKEDLVKKNSRAAKR